MCIIFKLKILEKADQHCVSQGESVFRLRNFNNVGFLHFYIFYILQ
jgi:hypothetical protein